LLPLKDDIPTRRFPIVTVAIIVINFVVFFGLQGATISGDGAHVDDSKTVEYAAIPYELTHPGKHCVATQTISTQTGIACGSDAALRSAHADPSGQPNTWLTLLFAMFMHGGLLHIGGNMLFLWIFGNNIEDAMNRFAFVGFYLVGGVVATFAQVALDTGSTTPTLGASGAIAAVLGAYAVLYPRARVVTLVFIIFFVTLLRLPALIVLGGWFLLQLLDFSQVGQIGDGGGGVAYLAHIGGFLFGMATIKLIATNVHSGYDRPQRLPVY
jgi:membrane associated rhomboid family serine protease